MEKIVVLKNDWNPALITLSEISEKFYFSDKQSIGFTPWKKFPYKPAASFSIAHSSDCIYLKYFVSEKEIRYVNREINSPVYEDSCVEFFIQFDSKGYYNLEFNCAGTILVGFGKNKSKRNLLSPELIGLIKCKAKLKELTSPRSFYWELTIVIPIQLFIHHDLKTFEGIRARANFYKCGDLLPDPHFLAWSCIESETPNFHLPEFFGELQFE